MKDSKLVGIEAAKALADAVNIIGGVAEEAFVEELTVRTHRTLQQAAGNLMFQAIAKFAAEHDRGNYDLRNEALGKACKQIVESNPDLFDHRMPMI